jgi:hypothetical protein
VTAECDLVLPNFSSAWMLANSLRALATGLGFQLIPDITGNLCRSSVDLVEFGVNSIPCQNNVLCLSLIPKGTESEKVYQISWDDLRNAIILLCCVKQCCATDCLMCIKLQQLLSDENGPSICGATNSAMVGFRFRQLCAIISRAGATFSRN